MKSFFAATFVFLFGFAVVWYYLSPATRDKTMAFIGSALQRDTREIAATLVDEFTPESPQEKEKALFSKLKENFTEVKSVLNKQDKESAAKNDVEKVLAESEKLVQELEAINKEDGVKEKLMDRVLDSVFPSRDQRCKE